MPKRTFAAVIMAGAFIALTPMAAHADTYLDEVTQGLQFSNLYVSTVVSDLSADDQSALITNIGSSDIAIAVLPASARDEITDLAAFARDVASRTGHDTVLISIGGDFEASSSVIDSGLASQYANGAEGNGTAAGLNEFVDEVQASVPVSQPNTGGSQGGFDAGVVIWPLSIVLVLAAGVTVFVTMFRRRRDKTEYTGQHAVTSKFDKAVPDVIRRLLEQVTELAEKMHDIDLVDTLATARTDVGELFKRLRKRQPDKIQQITAQYQGNLETVLQVVDRYVDIQNFPRYYPHPDEWLRTGKVALRDYSDGVVQNIQEIEQGAMTNFAVDTKILGATKKEEMPYPLREERS